MTKFFGCLIAASFVFSWYALSSIKPMEESSTTALNAEGTTPTSVTTSSVQVVAVPGQKSSKPKPAPNPVGEVTTSELPQQPVYEAPVLDQKWEQSWSGPTIESYPSDITIIPLASPVVNPVLELNLPALQERIIQIQQHVVEQFMQRQTLSFTLPGVN